MKKYIKSITAIFACSFILMACSDDENANNNQSNQENTESNEQQNNDSSLNDDGSDDDNSNENVEENNDTENNSSDNSDDAADIETEDQKNLKIGETGMVETTIGTIEMTLDDAELVGPEFDGEETFEDDLILLDITIKNVGDDAIVIEDVMQGIEVTHLLDGTGNNNGAEDFDSVEEFTGDLEPGEEKSGQFITDVTTADEYYLRQDPSSVGAGGSNQVMWKFKAEEAK